MPRIPFYVPTIRNTMRVMLPILKKHYNPSQYDSTSECPVANAAKEAFETMSVLNRVDTIKIGSVNYAHKPYTRRMYDADMKKAKAARSGDTVIRVVGLTKKG